MTESSIKKIRVPQNPFLLFLPLLIFYILFICIFTHTEPWGDETRNLRDINNLLHGSFSPPPPDIILGSGPGYQLLVLPFAALHLPLLTIKLLNAVFLYLSVVFLFKVLIRLVSFKKAALFSLFWGCYYNSFDFLPVMYSETITLLLISLLLFCMMNVFTPDEKIGSKKYIFLSGIVFGYLILTKVIFAYVLICMLLGIGFLWLFNRKAVNYKKSFLILLIAAITILPYLFYTYQLTGRVFYLSTQSGNNLYWMSSPEENEYGSWFASQLHPKDSVQAAAEIVPKEKSTIDFKARGYYLPGYEDTIARLHKKDMAELSQYEYSGLELDDAYKRIAMDNIKAHPFKYIKNCFSNIGRILFNYPYSYSLQKPTTLLRFPLNGLILLLMLVCAIPTFKNWKQIPFAIRFMLFAVFIYLGGSLLGCAEIRMFTVAVPVLLVWIACIMEKSVRISFGKWQ